MDMPTIFIGTVIFIGMTLLTFAVGIKTGKESIKLPKPMVFDLAKAIATSKFASTPEQVGAVMGVVVGVLGLENTVASDAAKLRVNEDSLQAQNAEEKRETEVEIARLRLAIADLETSTVGSQGRVTEANEVEALFSA